MFYVRSLYVVSSCVLTWKRYICIYILVKCCRKSFPRFTKIKNKNFAIIISYYNEPTFKIKIIVKVIANKSSKTPTR